MKSIVPLTVLVLAVAVILALSAGTLYKQRSELMNEFAARQESVAAGEGDSLVAHLDALNQDARMLSNLIRKTRGSAGLDSAGQNRIISAAFEALVAAVEPYRVIALRGPSGVSAVAVDPRESQAEAKVILHQTDLVARSVAKGANAAALTRPMALTPTRYFYFLSVSVGLDESLVITTDAGMFLRSVLRGPNSDTRLIVVDPSGAVWSGCDGSSRCVPTDGDQMRDILTPNAVQAQIWLESPRAQSLGLPGSRAVITTVPLRSTGGHWRLLTATSAALTARDEASLIRRLLLTSLAAALAVVGVGLFILRQQRRSVTLQERLRTAEELATLRAESDAILENAPVGILGVTADGRVAVANRFLEEKLGPIRIGQPVQEAFAVGPTEGMRLLFELLERTRGNTNGNVMAQGLRLLAPAPGEFDVRLVPLAHPSDQIQALAVVEDRSELRALERHLVRAEKLLTVGVLSAGLAHELGTPISVIRGRAEHLLEQDPQKPLSSAAHDLKVVVKHADLIVATIREVLEFSRTQAIHLEPVAILDALARASDLLNWKLERKHLRFAINLPSVPPVLAADPAQLQQVLVNVILNASDACDEGGSIEASLTTETPNGGRAIIEIVDNGCGIPPEHLNAVFDPFFTTKKRGEGTGLGLTIVASIVRNHGGDVALTSSPGQGTKVTISWPVDTRNTRT